MAESLVDYTETYQFGEKVESTIWGVSTNQVARPYLTPATCEILGFLNEPCRPRSKYRRTDFLEIFYPSQDEEIRQFHAMLKQFFAETGMKNDIEVEATGREGKHTIFYSPRVAAALNSFYLQKQEAEEWVPHDTNGHPYPVFDTSIFHPPTDIIYRLAFLRGAYRRFGVKGRNLIISGGHGAESDLIIWALDGSYCRNIRFIADPFICPGGKLIVFLPTNAVKEQLGIQTIVQIFLEDIKPDDPTLPKTYHKRFSEKP
ncbi:MAG: hypothetical protein WCS70_05210 [Verrucomicrobiota bacterium]